MVSNLSQGRAVAGHEGRPVAQTYFNWTTLSDSSSFTKSAGSEPFFTSRAARLRKKISG
jgi:hypothetical protein